MFLQEPAAIGRSQWLRYTLGRSNKNEGPAKLLHQLVFAMAPLSRIVILVAVLIAAIAGVDAQFSPTLSCSALVDNSEHATWPATSYQAGQVPSYVKGVCHAGYTPTNGVAPERFCGGLNQWSQVVYGGCSRTFLGCECFLDCPLTRNGPPFLYSCHLLPRHH